MQYRGRPLPSHAWISGACDGPAVPPGDGAHVKRWASSMHTVHCAAAVTEAMSYDARAQLSGLGHWVCGHMCHIVSPRQAHSQSDHPAAMFTP